MYSIVNTLLKWYSPIKHEGSDVKQDATNPEKQEIKNRISWFKKLRMSAASWFVQKLYGREMTITPFSNSAIAGLVVFWYLEGGVRHYVMIKNSKIKSGARFVSCLGLGENENITQATQNTVRTLLGSVFYKSLDSNLIAQDRVASVPTFKCEEPTLGESVPVNGVVWAVQISPEQAGLCQPEMKNVDVVAVPEFAIGGNEVAQSHQMVYQSVLKHIHGTKQTLKEFGVDQLEDAFQDMVGKKSSSKTIH